MRLHPSSSVISQRYEKVMVLTWRFTLQVRLSVVEVEWVWFAEFEPLNQSYNIKIQQQKQFPELCTDVTCEFLNAFFLFLFSKVWTPNRWQIHQKPKGQLQTDSCTSTYIFITNSTHASQQEGPWFKFWSEGYFCLDFACFSCICVGFYSGFFPPSKNILNCS